MLIAYLLLIGASLCLCGMAFLRKKYQLSNGTSIFPSLIFTIVYNLFVSIVGLIFIGINNKFRCLATSSPYVVILAVTLSITVTITTIICIIGSLYGSLVIIIMMATLGQLVLSTIYGIVFDSSRNTMTPWIIVGFVLSIIVLSLNFFDRKKEEDSNKQTKKNKVIYWVLCFVVFITNGIALIIYSLMTKYFPEYGYVDFIFLYSSFGCIVALIILLFIILFRRRKGERFEFRNIISVKNLLYIFLYAVLFLSGEFASLYTTGLIPIVVQAPLSFAIQLVIITLFDRLIFKTRLTWINYTQMGLALVCSVMFAI